VEWYRVVVATVFDAMSLQDQFQAIYTANGSPKDVALFTTLPDNDGVYFYYFTPIASSLAMPLINSYAGNPCETPHFDTNTLTLGDPSAIALLAGEAGSY